MKGIRFQWKDNVNDQKLENFIASFHSLGGGGFGVECNCGRLFYNSTGGWTWEEGELEQWEADKQSVDLDWPVCTLIFEDKEYVIDCECWKERAAVLVKWMDGHAKQIAAYLSLEKQRKLDEFNSSPVVKAL